MEPSRGDARCQTATAGLRPLRRTAVGQSAANVARTCTPLPGLDALAVSMGEFLSSFRENELFSHLDPGECHFRCSRWWRRQRRGRRRLAPD
jgi:hypothetical protein